METLYRKYRPQTFEQVVGQKPIVETLKRAVEEQKLSHAYLFCGPRGTGKTTMARLVAKSFVCALGSGKVPDGTCEPCVLVARGLHPDIYELDAASRTGVDAVREEIVNRVDFAPVQARGKVYIIDEVHMLTTAAFNALLKTLEEPPSHVIFILCTTDPQKIPATVLSRVQRFDFKNIDQADMVAHLEHVSAAEGWTAEKPALELIARHSHGAMRNALSSLEQLSVFGNGSISLEHTQALFGEESDDRVVRTLEALGTRQLAEAYIEAVRLIQDGVDPIQFAERLESALVQIIAAFSLQAAPEAFMTEEEFLRAKRLAGMFETQERAVAALEYADKARLELRGATNAELVLQVAFTKMIGGVGRETVARGALKSEVATEEVSETKASLPQLSADEVAAPKIPVGEATQKEVFQQGVSANTVPTSSEVSKQPNTPERIEHERSWASVVAALQKKPGPLSAFLLNSELKKDDGNTLTVALPAGNDFALTMLEQEQNVREVALAVSTVFGPRSITYVQQNMAGVSQGQSAEKPAVAPQSELVAAKPAPAQAAASKPVPTQTAAVASVPTQPAAVEPAPAQTAAPETPLAQAAAPEPAQKQQTTQTEDEDLLSMATEIFGEGVKVFSETDKE